MKASPIRLPYIPHEDRKAQKLIEKIAKILSAKAQSTQSLPRNV